MVSGVPLQPLCLQKREWRLRKGSDPPRAAQSACGHLSTPSSPGTSSTPASAPASAEPPATWAQPASYT